MSANSSGGQLLRQPGKGLALAFIGGMALSIDIPLIRLAASDPWLVMAARGLGAATVLGLVGWIFRHQLKLPKGILWDPDFLLVGSLSGLNNIFFTLAVFNTSAANVVFILAFNAMIAALMSWSFIGERPAFEI